MNTESALRRLAEIIRRKHLVFTTECVRVQSPRLPRQHSCPDSDAPRREAPTAGEGKHRTPPVEHCKAANVPAAPSIGGLTASSPGAAPPVYSRQDVHPTSRAFHP